MNPTVAIQIVTYNSSKDIETCLEAVYNQTHPIACICVIDNASSDDMMKQLQPYSDQAQIVANSDNNGFAGGHNQGFALSETEYILVLNPDVVMHPDYVRELVHFMEQNPEYGMATGKLFKNKAATVIDSTGIVMKKNRRAFDRGADSTELSSWEHSADVFGVSGAAALYRRTMIEDVSIDGEFFDESFFAYKEDVDVCWRAQLMGWQARFVSTAFAYHARGWNTDKSRKDVNLKIRRHSYINRYYYIVKNDTWLYLILHAPFILFYEILSIGYVIIKERELLEAWSHIWKQRKQLFSKRRAIQKKRRVSYKTIYQFFQGVW
ncbi:glycosyltransferase family 2 protein [Bacillus sp. HMF5848]|uniref:glycosyltransferase family 2 protein n=1 Tax=Bacillus sp. HMF5848 TaxID=2495421 RepID=UPI000F76C4DA|nr:glycosyltransferase family 2 protein [Bacillus sp. HMF5848]RSK28665.1 glycosyltransferase family 2 protein [Bacillus sp. HMF5848]